MSHSMSRLWQDRWNSISASCKGGAQLKLTIRLGPTVRRAQSCGVTSSWQH